jgi:hypothetical protein
MRNGETFVQGFACFSDNSASNVMKRGQCSETGVICSSKVTGVSKAVDKRFLEEAMVE